MGKSYLAMSLIVAAAAMAGVQMPARAAEVHVITTGAIKAALDALAPMYEKSSGDKLILQYESSVPEREKLEGGASFDLAIGAAALMNSLADKGIAAKGTLSTLGALAAEVAYHHGDPAPDVSTPEALKALVLKAKSISYSDPALGGTSSVYFAGVIQTMGIADEVRRKAIMTKPGQGAAPVGEGKAEIGVAQSSEIAMVPGLDGVPLFPADPKSKSTLAMAVSSKAGNAAGAAAFEKYLVSPEATAVLRAKGVLAN